MAPGRETEAGTSPWLPYEPGRAREPGAWVPSTPGAKSGWRSRRAPRDGHRPVTFLRLLLPAKPPAPPVQWIYGPEPSFLRVGLEQEAARQPPVPALHGLHLQRKSRNHRPGRRLPATACPATRFSTKPHCPSGPFEIPQTRRRNLPRVSWALPWPQLPGMGCHRPQGAILKSRRFCPLSPGEKPPPSRQAHGKGVAPGITIPPGA